MKSKHKRGRMHVLKAALRDALNILTDFELNRIADGPDKPISTQEATWIVQRSHLAPGQKLEIINQIIPVLGPSGTIY